MNEDPETHLGRTLSFGDAVRFLEKVCQPGGCPICNAKSWQLPMQSAESPVSLVQSGLTFHSVPELELKMFCNRCGFLRSHSLSFIFGWLDQNPADGDGSDE